MFRRLLLLWALLPALCLGLLGQGHDMVLCQETCGCVAMEMAHDPARHADCADHADHTDQRHARGCNDTALDAGDHVAPQAVKLPDLTAYPCGAFVAAWMPARDVAVKVVSGLSSQASGRGPPQHQTQPPKALATLRTIVLLV